IMAMIGVMVLKWVMARYMLSARLYRSNASKIRTEGCHSKINSQMSDLTSTPDSGSCVIDGKTIKYKNTNKKKGQIKYTVDQDK
ncbi:MAG: hypothetical protein KAJ48_02785, partial [Elusimicrobiales bacterium]|nr:hypothetical protein [Elusimicrobiales bacterium]